MPRSSNGKIRIGQSPVNASDLRGLRLAARRWGEILGYNEQKDPPQLSEALDDALRQADTYDRELFETMGVKTIWLESFDDIPMLLDRISARSV